MGILFIVLLVANAVLGIFYVGFLLQFFGEIEDSDEYQRLTKLMVLFRKSPEEENMNKVVKLAEKLENYSLHRELRIRLMLVISLSWTIAGLISPIAVGLLGEVSSMFGTICIMFAHIYFMDHHGKSFYFDELKDYHIED